MGALVNKTTTSLKIPSGNKQRKSLKKVSFSDAKKPGMKGSSSPCKRRLYAFCRRHYVFLFLILMCLWGGLHIYIGINVKTLKIVEKPKPTEQPKDEYYKLRPKKVSPHNFRYLLRPKTMCAKYKEPFLLITVASLHQNKEYRDNIRRTWGSVTTTKKWPKGNLRINEIIKIVFLFGVHKNSTLNKLLIHEYRQFGDILQGDFVESYWNLTLKVLMGFKWMSQYCERSTFIMKADEDTFVNIPILLNQLKTRDWNNTIYGYGINNAVVIRRFGKHKVSMSAFPYQTYPPYCTGNMYVMPSELAKSLFYVSEYMPYVNIEDAHITGILAHVFNTKHVLVSRGMYNHDRPPDKCDFALDKKLYGQQVYTNLSRTIWNHIHNPAECRNISEARERAKAAKAASAREREMERERERKKAIELSRYPSGHPMRNAMLAFGIKKD